MYREKQVLISVLCRLYWRQILVLGIDQEYKIPESIMTEHDDFYEKLPYTLEENQVTPEYVIFGTGLQETLIAAYKSKMEGKVGLIIDTEKTYGSSLKTVTFKEFNLLATHQASEKMYNFITPESYREKNQQFYTQSVESKKHRGYSIDIEPCFFLAASTTCECLKQADMDKYMDFHLAKSILHIHNNQIKHVPLSKGKIFESTDLSLLQKKHLLSSLHKLMKIYQKYTNTQVDLNSTKEFDKDTVAIDESLYKQFQDGLDKIFLPFVGKLVKNNKKILDFLAYIICNYQYNYDKPIPDHAKSSYTLKGFINRFGKFIKSCGIYGEIPYLYVDNGIGDIPQAFSRIASIYASVYILHPKIQITSITKQNSEEYHIVTNLSPQRPIVTKQIFYGPTHLDLRKIKEEFYSQKLLRVFVLAKKTSKEQPCPAICFINQLQTFPNPIFMFMFDSASHSCPSDMIIYQFQTVVEEEPKEMYQMKGQKLLNVLQSVYGQEFRQSVRYYSVYTRTRRYPKKSENEGQEGVGLNDTMGIDLDQHFQNFISIIGQKDNYFKKQNPQQEEEDEYGDETKYILQRMDQLNINEGAKPEIGNNGVNEEANLEEAAAEVIQKQEQNNQPEPIQSQGIQQLAQANSPAVTREQSPKKQEQGC